MPTVLVIDDDPDMRELARTILQMDGLDVIEAANGLQGLQQVRESRPSLVLLDLMMPVMDGLTFLLEHHRSEAASVPVVCLSAGGEHLLARARVLGARECLAKPPDFEHLCETVRRFCHPG